MCRLEKQHHRSRGLEEYDPQPFLVCLVILRSKKARLGGGLVIRQAVSKIYLQAHVYSSTFGISIFPFLFVLEGLMIFSYVGHMIIIEIHACRNRPANIEHHRIMASEDDNQSDSTEEMCEPDELYDEGADDDDEKWVDTHLRQETTHLGKKEGPETDAILNCPCCFTTLCMDCQRHIRYKNQYRAMFTLDCIVKTNVRLLPSSSSPAEAKISSGPREKEERETKEKQRVPWQEEDEVLHPVVCASCGTEVGVQDKDEVVHFFNVIAS